MELKKYFLEAKWHLYRPIIWLQYGFGFLIIDLYLDLRDKTEDREKVLNGWNDMKSGLIKDDPHKVAMGQSEVKTVIYRVMSEVMN